MAIVKISDLPLVDSPVEGTDLFVVVQDNVTKKAFASDIQTYVGFEEVQTATAGQTVFNLTTMTYAAGANNLMVFVDGVNQYEGSSYVETDNNTVTFTQGLHVGALVKFSTVQTQTSLVNSAGAVSFLQAGTGAVPTNVQARLRETVSVKDFGAVGDGVTDDRQAIVDAITYASTVWPTFGGITIYFPPTPNFYVVSSEIDIAGIFNLTTPAGQRLCQLWIEGAGRASHIRFTGTNPANSNFLFNFGSYDNNVGMTGGVRNLKMDTTASIGHTATAYTPTFTTQSSSAYGTNQTITTCILASCVLTPFVVENCEISLFNYGINFRTGFAPSVKDCNITKCNVAIRGGDTMTSLTLSGGNTIEECAVGWFIDNAAQMFSTSGINVIEANDCDILIYSGANMHVLNGVYHEASRYSHFFSSDATTDVNTPRQITIENCIGLDVGVNGGLLETTFRNCAFASGIVFGVNANQKLRHIVIEDCFQDNQTQPFDAFLITGSGIYSDYADQVFVVSSAKDLPWVLNNNPKVRPKTDLNRNRYFYESAANTLSSGCVITVPNAKASALIVIEGHKAYDIAAGAATSNPVYFKYLGILERDTNGATTVNWSATENVFESFASTLTPHVVATPTVVVTGANSTTQDVNLLFVQGYTGDISAGHYYNVSINCSIGNLSFTPNS